MTQLALTSVFCKGKILFSSRGFVKSQENCIYSYSPGLCSTEKARLFTLTLKR